MLETGAIAPAFTLTADDGTQVSLSDFPGKKVVLYFYPKANTPAFIIRVKMYRVCSPKLYQRFAARMYHPGSC